MVTQVAKFRFDPRDQYDQRTRTNKRFGDANVNVLMELLTISMVYIYT